MTKKPLIVLTGPTAVGKTELSVRLAKEINGSIVSADSMQVYKRMDIGSAKITNEEMQGIKHYLIDILEPGESFNIFLFKKYAEEAIDEIYAYGKIPIIAGGTGFYIQSVLYDIDFNENEDDGGRIREKYEKLLKEKGADYLYELLLQCDGNACLTIHKNNTKRVIRALEYYELTGNKISEHNEAMHEKESPYNFLYFVLNKDRQSLYNDIEKRVDIMFEKGLVDEVKALKSEGLNSDNISMQGLGYKEVLSYLDGEITIDEAKYIIKRDTRHFAKRQLTWFRREKDVIFINKEDYDFNNDLIIEHIKEHMKNAGII